MLESLERFADSKPAYKTIDPEQKKAIELPPRNVWWKSMWRHHSLYHYHRLVFMVVALNAIVFYQAVFHWDWFAADPINLSAVSNMAIVNIGIGILFRSQYVVNFLFKIATSVPKSWPLGIRQVAGKVYHFGGIHKGGNMVGTLWFALFEQQVDQHQQIKRHRRQHAQCH